MESNLFLETIQKELNPPQYEAVTYTKGPLLVLAGAGSGKTRVITYRISYLVHALHLSPWQILAVTFTNKAAEEMKERLAKLLGGEPRGLWIGTFHSICSRILRNAGKTIGIDPHFTIYDRGDQSAAVQRAIGSIVQNSKIKTTQVISAISRAKSRFEWPEQLEENAKDEQDHLLARIYREYQKILRQNNALDFDDLLMEAVRLLIENHEARSMYQQRFQYLLVDEYQDTNHPQYLLLKHLSQAHNRICAVGDDDQSIYGWRGASIRNILEFERDFPNVRIIKLEQNYRSTQTILAAAGKVVQNNRGRHTKTLWTQREKGEKIGVVVLPDEISEAYWICETAQRLHNQQKAPYRDMAVFYRVNAQSRLFEEECVKRSIPYILVGALAFYERKEIKDALCYFRLLLNPADSVSFQRIINVPKRKLGERSVWKLFDFAERLQIPIMEAACRIADAGRESDIPLNTALAFAQFGNLFKRWRQEAAKISLPQLLEKILIESGYQKSLEEEDDPYAQTRLENIEELINAAGQFVDRLKRDESNPPEALSQLEAYLENISLVSDVDQLDESKDALILMTVHGAKGLEFPYVFMAGMEQGLFPHSRSLDSRDQLEEERRLCYVGMTRAKQRLFLSYAETRRLYNRSERTRPSSFLEEIPQQLVEYLNRRGMDSLFTIDSEDSPQECRWYSLKKDERQSRLSKKEKKPEPFTQGDMVNHRTFGLGVVLAIEGEGGKAKVTVDFQNFGKKTLLQEYAPLQKV